MTLGKHDKHDNFIVLMYCLYDFYLLKILMQYIFNEYIKQKLCIIKIYWEFQWIYNKDSCY